MLVVGITMKTDCFGMNQVFEASVIIKLFFAYFELIPSLDGHHDVGLLACSFFCFHFKWIIPKCIPALAENILRMVRNAQKMISRMFFIDGYFPHLKDVTKKS